MLMSQTSPVGVKFFPYTARKHIFLFRPIICMAAEMAECSIALSFPINIFLVPFIPIYDCIKQLNDTSELVKEL